MMTQKMFQKKLPTTHRAKSVSPCSFKVLYSDIMKNPHNITNPMFTAFAKLSPLDMFEK
jgi:hypothetical protein